MNKIFIRLFLFPLVLVCAGCLNQNVSRPDKTSPDQIFQADWKTSVSTNGQLIFGTVSLHLAGRTSADNLTIETHGDGLINKRALIISNQLFDETINIAFTHMADTNERIFQTRLYYMKNTNEWITNLKSPPLRYLP